MQHSDVRLDKPLLHCCCAIFAHGVVVSDKGIFDRKIGSVIVKSVQPVYFWAKARF